MATPMEQAQALLAQGDGLFVDDEFARALACYNEAEAACPELASGEGAASAAAAAQFLTRRAAAHIELNSFEEALDDANAAVRLVPESHLGYFRKGVACFFLDEFETAKEAFDAAAAAAKGKETALHPVFAKWLRKCEAEIGDDTSGDDSDDDGDDEADSSDASDSDAAKPEDAAAAAAAAAGPAAKTDGAAGAAAAADDAAASNAAPPPLPAPTPAAPAAPVKRKLDFYQTATHVTIPVMKKGVVQDKSSVEFTIHSVAACLQTPDGSEFQFDVELFSKIAPEQSKVFWRPTKVEIKLAKATPNVPWPALEKEDVLPAAGVAASVGAAGVVVDAKAAKPPRPYAASDKDWDKLEAELKKEEEDEKPEGEEALQKLFKQIYGNADEKTRMAMNKSFQTSGGTVLSTNWDEVGKTDYEKERKAPDGMEWKKWG